MDSELQQIILETQSSVTQIVAKLHRMAVKPAQDVSHIKDMEAQIRSLEEENKRYLDTIIKQSKQRADNITMKSGLKPLKSTSHSILKNNQNGGPIGPTTIRNLSLNQVREFINDIYAAKIPYDKKCLESKLPRETME